MKQIKLKTINILLKKGLLIYKTVKTKGHSYNSSSELEKGSVSDCTSVQHHKQRAPSHAPRPQEGRQGKREVGIEKGDEESRKEAGGREGRGRRKKDIPCTHLLYTSGVKIVCN